MDTTLSPPAQADYNNAAVTIGEKLYAARQAISRADDKSGKPMQDVFPAYNLAGLGLALEYERMGNQPVSSQLLARAQAFGIEFEHLGITIGTVIRNINLKDSLSAELVAFIRDTLLERKVIFFRDQHLTQDEQVVFGRRFGELDAFPFGKPGENPYILEIVHGPGQPGTENGWHTDVTWMERPSLGSIAQCVDVPPVGGDTLFSDSHACYLGLPRELQAQLQHLHGINDYGYFIGERGSAPIDPELVASIKQQIPYGVSHPLLRSHPETGKTGLYFNAGFLRHDSLYDVRSGEALDPAVSQKIVNMMQQQHTRPEYQCRFKWAPGSVSFWDNRAVQHYASSDYYPHHRLLRRVTLSGDRPFYAPAADHPTS